MYKPGEVAKIAESYFEFRNLLRIAEEYKTFEEIREARAIIEKIPKDVARVLGLVSKAAESEANVKRQLREERAGHDLTSLVS